MKVEPKFIEAGIAPEGDMVRERSYADKAGKCQDQAGLTLPRVD